MNIDAKDDGVVMPGQKSPSLDDLYPDQEVNETKEVEVEDVQQEQSQEISPESSTGSEEQHEQKSNGFQKRINDITAKRYQAERERDELQKRIAEFETQSQVKPVTKLVAPSLPDDMYDRDEMKQYHDDMVKFNQESAQEAASSHYDNSQAKQRDNDSKVAQKKVIGTYVENAMRDGVDIDKLKVSGDALIQAGVSPALESFILNDVNGARITEYLADNPAEMHEILRMDPVSAGIRIANEIKPKILSSTPKVSNAPQPIPTVKGGGYVEQTDFDKTYKGYEII